MGEQFSEYKTIPILRLITFLHLFSSLIVFLHPHLIVSFNILPKSTNLNSEIGAMDRRNLQLATDDLGMGRNR